MTLGTQITRGWVPVYHGERKVFGSGVNVRIWLPGDAAWSWFTTSKPASDARLPGPGWRWHYVPISRRRSNVYSSR